jgi:hypothetical protein
MSNVSRQIKYTCDSIKGNQNLHSINSVGVGDIIKLLKIDLFCRDLTLANCAGEAQHLEKVRIWSPPGLPNVQSSTARPKTPRIEVFLVSLERSWSVDIENGLLLAIWTSAAQVMGKRRAGVKLAVWLPTTKSRKSTSFRPPNWECDTSLERSRRGLQVWFRPRCDQTSKSGVMSSQSPGTPPETVSGQFRDSNPEVPGKSDIRAWVPRSVIEYTIRSKVVAYSRVRAVVCLVVQNACGLSQHPKVSRMLN